MNELELRKHRCCFTGHRPHKLAAPENEVKKWLNNEIERAISEGFVTFITGCAMGTDIWAGQIIIEKRRQNPSLHLIAASPYPNFEKRWTPEWQEQYLRLLEGADLVRYISKQYSEDCFIIRNRWMVDHSSKLIAVYNGTPGGTRNTIAYAKMNNLKIVTF